MPRKKLRVVRKPPGQQSRPEKLQNLKAARAAKKAYAKQRRKPPKRKAKRVPKPARKTGWTKGKRLIKKKKRKKAKLRTVYIPEDFFISWEK